MKQEIKENKGNKKTLKKRLKLNKETIRELENSELKMIGGAVMRDTFPMSVCACYGGTNICFYTA
jgi:hypothetical protein